MKQYRNEGSSNLLLDTINYGSTKDLKTIIHHLLSLDESSISDSSQICIVTDLKQAMGLYKNSDDLRVLNDKQRDVLVRHLVNDETQERIAKDYGISQQGVSVILNTGLRRMKTHLTGGTINRIPWTRKEKAYLLYNYNRLSLDIISENLHKDKSKVTSMYHYLKGKDVK